MKIYTKTGDSGQTQVYADKAIKLSKSADELHCYGTLDELNSHVGLLQSMLSSPSELLTDVQRNLFNIGFAISATGQLSEKDVHKLESAIDAITETLPAQTSFILPGGTRAACQAHICRTVARRAERYLAALNDAYDIAPAISAYLNRLSDFFFVLARQLNHQAHIDDQQL